MTLKKVDNISYSEKLADNINNYQKPIIVMSKQLEPLIDQIMSIYKKHNKKTLGDLNLLLNSIPKAEELLDNMIRNHEIIVDIYDKVDYFKLNCSDEITTAKKNKKDTLENMKSMIRIRERLLTLKNLPVSRVFRG